MQLPTLFAASPMQEVLLPRSVQECAALLEFAHIGKDLAQPIYQATKPGGEWSDHDGALLPVDSVATPGSVLAGACGREWQNRTVAGISCQLCPRSVRNPR